jgi:hypothetical protein
MVSRDEQRLSTAWTQVERWCWNRIKAGQVADLTQRNSSSGCKLDPSKPDKWCNTRRLRASFLRAVLTERCLVDATPVEGVRVEGALLEGRAIDLDHAHLTRPLRIQKSRLLVAVRCSWMRADGPVSLEDTYVAGEISFVASRLEAGLTLAAGRFESKIDLAGARVSYNLLLNRTAIFEGEVNLAATEIDGSLDASGSTFKRGLHMRYISIGGGLSMTRSTFCDVMSLEDATIAGTISIHNCNFARFQMDGARIDGYCFLSNSEVSDQVSLAGVSIGRSLVAVGTIFRRAVTFDSARIGGACILRNDSVFERDIVLYAVQITSVFDISNSLFCKRLDLTLCKIGGELRLGSHKYKPARWGPGSRLVLQNAHALTLQDWWNGPEDNSWPTDVRLDGFTYDRLGGFAGDVKATNMLQRSVKDYLKWLEPDKHYSSQPYEQLAKLFTSIGDVDRANSILYEGRERRRRQARETREWGRWLGLSLLSWTIGYGIGARYFRTLWWVSGFTLLGTLMLLMSSLMQVNGPPVDWLTIVFASLDQLLPIITLNNGYDAYIFGEKLGHVQPDFVVVYFYLHKIAGFVLGSFLVAGLAGLTQK